MQASICFETVLMGPAFVREHAEASKHFEEKRKRRDLISQAVMCPRRKSEWVAPRPPQCVTKGGGRSVVSYVLLRLSDC